MFKVIFTKLNKRNVLENLGISENETDYTYVLTDDPNCCEKDKISIVFNESNIDIMKKVVRQLVAGEAYYITLENSMGTKKINLKYVEYFEAIENDVFAIVGKERYYVLEKLYVLENTLSEKNFARVSKSCLVNTMRINYIRPMLYYKLQLNMLNGDVIDVNRTYTKSFKEKIKN